MDANLRKRVEEWIQEDPDPNTKAELQELLDCEDEEELGERFHNRLEFGTAGLRGVLGGGPGRMNRSLVRHVTAGLAAYILREIDRAAERGVVVGYDGRWMSPEFAGDVVAVLGGAGIRAYLFPEVCTTPLAAFTVERLGAAAGVMVTASHNPPQDNGYKVYWENGAQIIPPHDKGISAAIDEIGSLSSVILSEKPAEPVPKAVIDAYESRVLALCPHPEADRGLRVVYSAMHGVGGKSVRSVFAKAGFDLTVVPEQADPDPDFPTVKFPNPEEPGAMDLSLALAKKVNAELILANDPDADRLAVIVPGADQGEFTPLSGNEIGAVLAEYLLSEAKPAGETLVATTIVSSRLLSKQAAAHGARYAETLTGFKWIANKAIEKRRDSGWEFLFGFEEALGYTVGELVRDKDGVSAALVFAELTAWLKSQGRSVLEYLEAIYREHGLHTGAQHSLTLPGSSGAEQIQQTMANLRAAPPASLGGASVDVVGDLLTGKLRRLSSGEEQSLDLPSSNVLRFDLADGTRILARPSGTEPKIKFYVEVVSKLGTETLTQAEAQGQIRVQEVLKDVLKAAALEG